jgi:hypothetical protein
MSSLQTFGSKDLPADYSYNDQDEALEPIQSRMETLPNTKRQQKLQELALGIAVTRESIFDLPPDELAMLAEEMDEAEMN